ncbi:hypothetical protein PVL30_001018 [Lodderomyces elongisporus]|uniref:uncharacterized protein n=1 Tax=Lodderomyces elongisporus TaxID=36914 RepID=UPI002926A6EF|nr:uncharacterized protein PVL30_001018 [Lodderomyces elongisporus]WLF77306.1 hypothetical protein PVL30_001018 [Lodderomyces elongisporus]
MTSLNLLAEKASTSSYSSQPQPQPQLQLQKPITIYDFKLPDASNKIIDFAQFHNKVLLIVNVASLCGFTPQYIDLQKLYKKYHSRGLVILAFPCNQFAYQDPMSSRKIADHCQREFGVEFPIMKKIKVNGEETSPLYDFLKERQAALFGFKGVRWNFEKFVVNKSGDVVGRFDSWVTPLQMDEYIVNLLNESDISIDEDEEEDKDKEEKGEEDKDKGEEDKGEEDKDKEDNDKEDKDQIIEKQNQTDNQALPTNNLELEPTVSTAEEVKHDETNAIVLEAPKVNYTPSTALQNATNSQETKVPSFEKENKIRDTQSAETLDPGHMDLHATSLLENADTTTVDSEPESQMLANKTQETYCSLDQMTNSSRSAKSQEKNEEGNLKNTNTTEVNDHDDGSLLYHHQPNIDVLCVQEENLAKKPVLKERKSWILHRKKKTNKFSDLGKDDGNFNDSASFIKVKRKFSSLFLHKRDV